MLFDTILCESMKEKSEVGDEKEENNHISDIVFDIFDSNKIAFN